MVILAGFVVLLWSIALWNAILCILLLPRIGRDEGTVATRFVSVIIPARDEVENIGTTVDAFLRQNYPGFEVIVVDDRSSDGTGAEALRAAGDDPRFQLISGSEPSEGWLGKPWALHQGAVAARGELLLFVDADVHYAPEALAGAVSLQSRTGAELLSLLPRFILGGFWERVLMPQLALVVIAFLPSWLSNRSRLAWLAIGGGTGNLVTRAAYDEVGGHVSLRNAVIDDVGLARLVRRGGHRTMVALADQLVSLRMYSGFGEVVRGFTKNMYTVIGSIPIALGVVLLMLAGHVAPYFWAAGGAIDLFVSGRPSTIGLAGLVSVLLITVVRLLVFRWLRYPIGIALFAHPLMMLVWSWIVLRSIWYTGVRNEVIWRGRSYVASRTRFGG